MKQKLKQLAELAARNSKLLAAGVVTSPFLAHADTGTDVSGVVTAITAVAATVALIGAPKLIMRVGVKIWGWISSVI